MEKRSLSIILEDNKNLSLGEIRRKIVEKYGEKHSSISKNCSNYNSTKCYFIFKIVMKQSLEDSFIGNQKQINEISIGSQSQVI